MEACTCVSKSGPMKVSLPEHPVTVAILRIALMALLLGLPGFAAAQTNGGAVKLVVLGDSLVAGYGLVLHGLPAGCAAFSPMVAANAAAGDADDMSAAALEALVEFETGAGGSAH